MINAIEKNLLVGMRLLSTLTTDQYRDTSVEPYHSSIGGHVRHILDIFDCIFSGLENGRIDLTQRSRNEIAELDIQAGQDYFKATLTQLHALRQSNLSQIIDVSDDLGLGMVTAKYTIAAALISAHSHAIHHFASLGYVLTRLDINLPHEDFGINPTTPRTAA